jgi:competence protein ComEA
MVRTMVCVTALGALLATAFPAVAVAVPVAAPTVAKAPALVAVNVAAAEELASLPKIGPALAQRIVDYRKANGPFRQVDDLAKVAGIGPKLLERLRPLVTVEVPVAKPVL